MVYEFELYRESTKVSEVGILSLVWFLVLLWFWSTSGTGFGGGGGRWFHII